MPVNLQNLYGTPPMDWTAAYGGRPLVPSPGASATSAIDANIGNLGSLYGLAGGLNQFNAGQAANQLALNLPGYSSMIGQSSQNIGSLLRGEVPQDVIAQTVNQRAGAGVGTGIHPDAPAFNAAIRAALGQTSLGLQAQGEQALTGAINRTPRADLFNPASMFVSPEQWQQAQGAANLYASAPNPAAAAAAAEAAARRGIQAGAGSVGGTGVMRPNLGGGPTGGLSDFFGNQGGTIVGSNPNAGSVIGGVAYGPGYSPGSAAQNWADWWSSPGTNITGNVTGGGGGGENWWETPEGTMDYLFYGGSPNEGADSGYVPGEDYGNTGGDFNWEDFLGGGDTWFDYYG